MKQFDLSKTGRPSAQQLEKELRRLKRKSEIRKSIISTLSALIVTAAAVTLILTQWLPVLQVQRSSMSPTLRDGEVIIFITTGQIERGDIIAFYQGNQVLIKRVIAASGDEVDLNDDGSVLLNGAPLDEPYVIAHSMGEYDIALPALVPENRFFVLGDQRQSSLDSRSSEIGTIHQDQIVGKALFRIWPPDNLGSVR